MSPRPETVGPTDDYTEERLAELLALLRPAPTAWMKAAQELPRWRSLLDELVARAEADAAFRQALVEDLESALEREGYGRDEALIAELRRHLSSDR